MCNKLNVIEDVIAQKTSAKEMFTAYDVTTAARKQEGEFIDNHRKIKRDVHSSFVDGGMPHDYVRTLVGLKDGNGKVVDVFMYHPISSEPTDYQPTDTSLKVVSLDGEPVDEVDEDEDEDEEYVKDKDGRLNIPQKFLKKIGIVAGDKVVVTESQAKIYISVWDTFRSATLTVNADGRVRLNKTILENIVEPYAIVVENDNTIVVS